MLQLWCIVGLVFIITHWHCVESQSTDCTELDATISGSIKSHTGYPNTEYATDMAVCWILRAPVGYSIHMYTQDSFRLEEHPNDTNCFDYVLIRYGRDGSDGECGYGAYCGHDGEDGFDIATESNIIRIDFHSDSTITDDGFEFFYEAAYDCTVLTITNEAPNSIDSHDGYPDVNYTNHIYTCWVIEAQTHKFVHLWTSDDDVFQLEDHGSCLYDYVRISYETEDDAVINTYCGDKGLEGSIFSNANRVIIQFHSDISDTFAGFRLHYEAVECLVLLIDGDEQGFITSHPDYPDTNYQNNIDRCWVIKAPQGKFVRLWMSPDDAFEFAYEAGCDYDYLRITKGENGGSAIGKYCGDTGIEDVIYSNINVVTVEFHSDHIRRYAGFKLYYEAVDCFTVFASTDDEAYIVSHPGYPNSQYDSNTDECWIIQAPAGKYIQLRTSEDDPFELADSANCERDHLRISAVPSSEDDMLGIYCGDSGLDDTLYSNSIAVKLEFRSHTFQYAGFKLYYKAYDCLIHLTHTDWPGYIDSHEGYLIETYQNDLDVCWEIRADQSSTIRLWTGDIFGVEGSPVCQYDHLRLINKYGDDETIIGTYCGTAGIGEPIESTSNMVLVQFHTDYSQTMRGFRLYYQQMQTTQTSMTPTTTAAPTTTVRMTSPTTLSTSQTTVTSATTQPIPDDTEGSKSTSKGYRLEEGIGVGIGFSVGIALLYVAVLLVKHAVTYCRQRNQRPAETYLDKHRKSSVYTLNMVGGQNMCNTAFEADTNDNTRKADRPKLMKPEKPGVGEKRAQNTYIAMSTKRECMGNVDSGTNHVDSGDNNDLYAAIDIGDAATERVDSVSQRVDSVAKRVDAATNRVDSIRGESGAYLDPRSVQDLYDHPPDRTNFLP